MRSDGGVDRISLPYRRLTLRSQRWTKRCMVQVVVLTIFTDSTTAKVHCGMASLWGQNGCGQRHPLAVSLAFTTPTLCHRPGDLNCSPWGASG